MRITDRYQSLMERAFSGAARQVDKNEKVGSGTRPTGKRAPSPRGLLEVNVSERAQELAAGTARLDELRASIKDGTFQVDPDAIASRLVGEGDEP